MPSFNQRLGVNRYEADEYYRQALEAYRKNDFDTASDRMTEAIELLPTKSEYYAARGLILLEDGADDKARADFEEALRLYDYEMLAHYGLGMLASRARQWEEAIARFQRASYIQPERAETVYSLALAHFHQGDLKNGIDTMVRANALLEAANDKRKSDSARWLKEMSRYLAKTVPKGGASQVQSQIDKPATLPLLGEE